MFRWFINLFLCLSLCIEFFPSNASAVTKTDSKNIPNGTPEDLCEKKLLKGVSFLKSDANGKKSTARIRFAPFQLPPTHQTAFNKFRKDFETQYGQRHDTHDFYNELVCRYFFGNYTYIELPKDIYAVNKLLQHCPLKVLKDIILAEGPIADCAPAVVNCSNPYKEKSLQHPLNKIACELKM